MPRRDFHHINDTPATLVWAMVGQHVRIKAAPHRIGQVISARYHSGQIMFLFRLDSRFVERFADMWFQDHDLEECVRPTDEYVAQINAIRNQRA